MSNEITFEGDSLEYEQLASATQRCIDELKDTTRMFTFVEIGVRGGLGCYTMLNTFLKYFTQTQPINQIVIGIGIDPYGNIEYNASETHQNARMNYTNEMKNKFLKNMYCLADKIHFNFLFFSLEDTEFFKRYSDGVPLYLNEKYMLNDYHLIHFDGPHTLKQVMIETEFFYERSKSKSVYVYDDIINFKKGDPMPKQYATEPITKCVFDEQDQIFYFYYNHSIVERWLFAHGFILLRKGLYKASYIRL